LVGIEVVQLVLPVRMLVFRVEHTGGMSLGGSRIANGDITFPTNDT
jgi:hypothetical protein